MCACLMCRCPSLLPRFLPQLQLLQRLAFQDFYFGEITRRGYVVVGRYGLIGRRRYAIYERLAGTANRLTLEQIISVLIESAKFPLLCEEEDQNMFWGFPRPNWSSSVCSCSHILFVGMKSAILPVDTLTTIINLIIVVAAIIFYRRWKRVG